MTTTKAPLRLLYVFSRGSRQEQEQLLAGYHAPSDLLYGYRDIDRGRFTVSYICRYLDERHVLPLLWLPFELAITKRLKMGFALGFALQHLSRLRAADVIVCTVDAIGLPIVLLKYLGLLTVPLIYISQGLTDRLHALPTGPTRKLFLAVYRRLLQSVDRCLVLGEGAAAPLEHIAAIPRSKIFAVTFGVDSSFWQPDPNPPPNRASYIMSIGSDAGRDYDTLLAAIGNLPLKLITRLPVTIPSDRRNITVSSNHSDLELRRLYQQAAFVVIPLKDVTQPSGQSATLQAMACGKAVILTRTRGLWEPTRLRHGENCYLVEPGDVGRLQSAIQYVSSHPDQASTIGQNARATVEKYFTSRVLARAIEEHCHAIVNSNHHA